jgi:hypothetical protein
MCTAMDSDSLFPTTIAYGFSKSRLPSSVVEQRSCNSEETEAHLLSQVNTLQSLGWLSTREAMSP